MNPTIGAEHLLWTAIDTPQSASPEPSAGCHETMLLGAVKGEVWAG
jgi:hypothetical protein